MFSENHLFSGERLNETFNQVEESCFKEINDFEPSYILNVDIQELIKSLESCYLFEIPEIQEDKIYIDFQEKNIDISQDQDRVVFDRSKPRYLKGTSIKFFIPFTGNPRLFDFQPSTFNFSPPIAKVEDNEIVIEISTLEHNPDEIKIEFNKQFQEIKRWLEWVAKDTKIFNDNLKQKILEKIDARRKKILDDQKLVAGLGFPLKKRENAPNTYTVPEIRRKILPKLSYSKIKPFVAEPVLDFKEYENILKIVTNMSLAFERSPKVFRNMKEEDIRTHFLVQLNGQYEGQATGETFNNEGKTDILIRYKGKNLFIAECKFWRGEEELKKSIDQLLGYLSWRDTKSAIFLFNRNKDMSKVSSQIPNIVKKHPNFKEQVDYNSETGFRYVLHHNDDKDRNIYLSVLVFEVPR